jgi:hypothetical protein
VAGVAANEATHRWYGLSWRVLRSNRRAWSEGFGRASVGSARAHPSVAVGHRQAPAHRTKHP